MVCRLIQAGIYNLSAQCAKEKSVMNKKEFYAQFVGSDIQALKMGGVYAVPQSISLKANTIISKMMKGGIDWDYTLMQLQAEVFDSREEKRRFENSGEVKPSELISVKDVQQAILQVYFNCQESEYWKGTMLMLKATKQGEILLCKTPYIEGFFKAREPKEAKSKKYTLAQDLEELLEKRGSAYEKIDLERLMNALELLDKGKLDSLEEKEAPKAVLLKKRA